MKLTAETLELIELRPAVYSETEYEFVISFTDQSLKKVGLERANALETQAGNTAYLYGTVLFEEDDKDNSFSREVYLFLTGDVLDDFIEQYGYKKINGDFTVRGEFVYKTYSASVFYNEDNEEIGGFILQEVLAFQEKEPIDAKERFKRAVMECLDVDN